LPTVTYTRGPDLGGGVGGLLYSQRPAGSSSNALLINHANARGDIIAQSNLAQSLTWTASYEAFGSHRFEFGSNPDSQRANSKEEDPTGYLHEHHRYRDIENETWLSRDPAGFVDGPNVYAYCKQNPWSSFDPDGLASWGLSSDYARSEKYRKGFHQGVAQGAKLGLVTAIGVGATVATGGLATTAAVAAFGSGTAATSLSAAAISGAAGGIAANSAANLLNGKPIGEGTLKAGATAALAAGAGQLLAKGALALKQAWTTARQTAGSIDKSAKTTQADAKDLAEGAGAGQGDAGGAPVIIGENMNRVNAYAGKVSGKTIDDWLDGRKWTPSLNNEFVATMKAQGRQIQDIGPDFGRRLQNRVDPSFGRPPSSVYEGERQSLLDYGNYQRLYERTGKHQGGVPGFDP
jgi:RHS repeat-associated protein